MLDNENVFSTFTEAVVAGDICMLFSEGGLHTLCMMTVTYQLFFIIYFLSSLSLLLPFFFLLLSPSFSLLFPFFFFLLSLSSPPFLLPPPLSLSLSSPSLLCAFVSDVQTAFPRAHGCVTVQSKELFSTFIFIFISTRSASSHCPSLLGFSPL